MTSKTGQQIITIQIYCPISQQVKGTRQIKFGQLIEYKMRNIFLEKSYTECGGKTSPRTLKYKN